MSPDGALRVLTSADGETWASAALLSVAGGDLRDPKLSVHALRASAAECRSRPASLFGGDLSVAGLVLRRRQRVV